MDNTEYPTSENDNTQQENPLRNEPQEIPGQFMPPPPPYGQPYPPMPPQGQPKQSGCALFMRKRVTIPLWLLIILILCSLGSIGSAMASKSDTSTTSTGSTNQVSNSNTQASNTPQPTTPPATPTDTPTPTPTPKPTPPPQWTVVQTFTGNGTKKTQVFTVPDHWKLTWSCDPNSDYSGEYNVMVDVKGSDGSDVDPVAVNTICKTGNTGDTTEEYQGGDVYLDVTSESAWKLQVQVLK